MLRNNSSDTKALELFIAPTKAILVSDRGRRRSYVYPVYKVLQRRGMSSLENTYNTIVLNKAVFVQYIWSLFDA
jgi:hypothetical protein